MVGVASALAAGSIALLAFGIDSGIEILASSVLLWRLMVEARGAGAERIRKVERRSARITGGLLLLLAAYVALLSVLALIHGEASRPSTWGLLLAVAALVVMPILIRRKREIAGRIGSAALKADAACGSVCVFMALFLLAGLFLNAVAGLWWADPVAGLGIVYFIVREGIEALSPDGTA